MEGGTTAAATLTLEISTTDAQKNLTELQTKYEHLRELFSGATTTNTFTGVTTGATEASQSIRSLEALVASLQAKLDQGSNAGAEAGARYAQSFGGLGTSLKVALADTQEKTDAITAKLKSFAEITRVLAAEQIPFSFKVDRNIAGIEALQGDARAAFEASSQYSKAWNEATLAAEKFNAATSRSLADEGLATRLAETNDRLWARKYAAEQAALAEKELAAATRALADDSLATRLAETNDRLWARKYAAEQAALAEKELAAATRALADDSLATRLAETNDRLWARKYAAEQAALAEKELAAATRALADDTLATRLAETNDRLWARKYVAEQAALAEKELAAATRALADEGLATRLAETNDRLWARKYAAEQAALAEKELSAEMARQAGIQELRDKQSYDASVSAHERQIAMERRYILASEQMRLKAAIDARKLMDSGYGGNLSQEFAPQTIATASATNLAALQASHAALSQTVGKSSDSLTHWSKVSNEAHAAARGLAGAVGGLWLTYGSLAPLLAGAAIAGGFKAAAKAGSEFAYELTFVKALGGESSESISRLSSTILEMGKNSLHGPVEMASGLRVLAQAGLDANDALLALPTTLDLATVGEMGTTEAAITLTGVMNAFNLKVSDMGHIGDVFAKAAAVSQTSVQAMTESMRMASVVGEQYGVKMEDAATALTLLAKVNITGTAAGTSLRNMLKELYTPADGAARVLKQLNVSATDAGGTLRPFADVVYSLKEELVKFDKGSQANILQKLFGERGAKQAIALLSQTREEWDKLKDSIENSDGFITQVAAELEMTTQGRFKQALNTMQTNMVKAFNESEGGVRSLADSLKDLADSKEFQVAINGIVGSVAALAKVLVDVSPYLIQFGAAFVGLKVLGLVSTSIIATTTAISGLGAALAIVQGTMATTTGLAAGLRAGLLATSSAAGVAAGATGLGGLATVAAALFSPAGWIAVGVAAVGGLAYALSRMTDGSNDATRSAHQLADALTRQTEKMRDEVELLRERNRLRKEGLDPDGAAESVVKARRDKIVSDLKFAESDLAEAQKSAGGNIFDTVTIMAARDTVTQLKSDLKIVNERIAEGATLQIEQVKDSLSATIDRMREEADKLDKSALKAGKPVDVTFRAQIKQLSENSVGITDTRQAKTIKSVLEDLLYDAQSSALGAGTKQFTESRESSANALFKAQTAEIKNGYEERVKAANEEFKNYKQILDQRVKYGAVAQGAENVLLEMAQSAVDQKTSALRESEKQELQALLASKETTEAEKLTIQTRITEIEAVQKSSEAGRAHILVLNQEKDALKQLADARKLDNDIASFAAQEQLSRERAISKDYLERNASGETIAGVEAYYATLERGQSQLKKYEEATRAAEAAQASLAEQIKTGTFANKSQSDSLQKLGSAQGSNLAKYEELFSQAAVQFSVDEALLKAVTYVESRGNANAVSPQGAKGLMQLMPATARSLGVKDSFDPQQNIFGGAKLLKENLGASGGNVDTALKMYHGGTNKENWGPKTQEYPVLVGKAYAELTKSMKAQIEVNKELTPSIESVDAAQLSSLDSVKSATSGAGEYTDTLRNQGAALDQNVVSEEAKTAAMAEAAKAVDTAREAQDKYKASVEAQAQANAQLAESLKGPEEALKRMQAAYSASSAVMDATLNARKTSGFYTDLEGMRAQGNINKEKIAQLAELKAAYEAMGNAGAAAAKQVEAQMIELSAHLDPVADKIRGIFESAFEQFFNDVTQGVKSIKEAFRDLGKSILKSFGEIIAKNASQELMKILGGGLKPGESQGLFSFLGNLLSPNGAGSAGSDIAATGKSIFSSLKGLGTGGGLQSTIQAAPLGSFSVGGGSASLMDSADDLTKNFASLGVAANDSIASFSNLGNVVNISSGTLSNFGTGLQSFEAVTTSAATGMTSLQTTSAAAEVAITSSTVSSGLADVSLAATAVSAEAASVGLSSVAASSSSDAVGSGVGSIAKLLAANGAAFDGTGARAFASGGVFTNKIVTSPTQFKFASGGSFSTGVMGEAGPEAVMPLTRDARGRLGVKTASEGQPINIKVIVNGNQSAPDVRRSAAQGAREGLAAFRGAQRYA